MVSRSYAVTRACQDEKTDLKHRDWTVVIHLLREVVATLWPLSVLLISHMLPFQHFKYVTVSLLWVVKGITDYKDRTNIKHGCHYDSNTKFAPWTLKVNLIPFCPCYFPGS